MTLHEAGNYLMPLALGGAVGLIAFFAVMLQALIQGQKIVVAALLLAIAANIVFLLLGAEALQGLAVAAGLMIPLVLLAALRLKRREAWLPAGVSVAGALVTFYCAVQIMAR